jgi:glycosyltransferase involved in cell wall biosynthesis
VDKDLNSQPIVSIIVVNYNYDRFLCEAIDSAIKQTYPHTEVVVVDDGSTDNSGEIIASYGSKVVPVLKKNGGQRSALNAGFAASRGEIVIFLDADDYLFPHTVERVVAVWEPGVVKVHYRLETVDTFGKRLGSEPPPDRLLSSGNVLPILLEKGYYSTNVCSGNAFGRAALDQVLPMPETGERMFAESYLHVLLPFFGRVASIEEALGAYRIHDNNDLASITAVNVDGLRRVVWHQLHNQTLLVHKAGELGYEVPPDVVRRNYVHVQKRLASLRLDPRKHPVSEDRPLRLVRWGLDAIWRYSGLDWKKRLMFSIWFLWAGVMPSLMVKPAVNWLFAPRSRPKAVDLVAKRIAYRA